MAFGAVVFSTAFFTVIKSGLNLSGPILLYPYALALAFYFFGRGRYAPRAVPVLLACCALCLVAAYHLIVLHEPIQGMLYPLRFYFGVFILFWGFASFLFWLDAGVEPVRRWLVGLIEAVLFGSFLVAALEYFGVISGLVHPARFWWTRTPDVADIANYQAAHIYSAIRAYGMASNPTVLAIFSIFLTVYYWGLVEGSLKRRNIFIILCGLATILLSMSGTGLLILLAVFAAITHRNWSRLNKADRSFRALLFLGVALVAIWSQANESGRFNPGSLVALGEHFSRTWPVFLGYMTHENFLGPIYGSINLLAAYHPGTKAPLDLAGSSFYDYAPLGFMMDIGLIGIVVYLSALLGLAVTAFPKSDFMSRLSVLALLAGSVHYPSCFWMCSQAMLAAILAAGIYMRHRQPIS